MSYVWSLHFSTCICISRNCLLRTVRQGLLFLGAELQLPQPRSQLLPHLCQGPTGWVGPGVSKFSRLKYTQQKSALLTDPQKRRTAKAKPRVSLFPCPVMDMGTKRQPSQYGKLCLPFSWASVEWTIRSFVQWTWQV